MKLDKLVTARILKETHYHESIYDKGTQEWSWGCFLWTEGALRLNTAESWEELGAFEELRTEGQQCPGGVANEKWER